jgi:hypothetical protein
VTSPSTVDAYCVKPRQTRGGQQINRIGGETGVLYERWMLFPDSRKEGRSQNGPLHDREHNQDYV